MKFFKKGKINMISKKLVASMLAFTLALGTFTVMPAEVSYSFGTAIAAEAAESDFIIETDVSGVEYIAGYNGKGGDIVIPEGYYIGFGAFYKNTDITGVTFTGDDYIREFAFINCVNLKKVVFKSNATIFSNAFENCVNLKTVEIDGVCETIGSDAFKNCQSLEKFTVKKSRKSDSDAYIGNNAFENCYMLKSFKIPNNIKKVGSRAFLNCVNLKSLIVPSDVKFNEGENGEREYFGFYEAAKSNKIITDDYDNSRLKVTDYEIANGKNYSYFLVTKYKIGECAFDGGSIIEYTSKAKKMMPVKLTVTVTRGSDAEKFCKENKIAYKYAKKK